MEGLFQPLHLIVILFIVLIIFGPGKLPELGEGLGKGIKSFKNAMKEGQDTAAIEQHKEEKKA
jgi:sec-independent protein translocase protein TatA